MKLRREEVPRHFEAPRLKAAVLVVAWPVAVAAAVAGVLLASRGTSVPVQVVGVAVAAAAAVLVTGLVRCRTFEIVVGPRLLTVGTGPLRRRIPVGMIATTEPRAAGSWRRLYADRELVLTLFDDQSSVIVPTVDPDGLETALLEGQ